MLLLDVGFCFFIGIFSVVLMADRQRRRHSAPLPNPRNRSPSSAPSHESSYKRIQALRRQFRMRQKAAGAGSQIDSKNRNSRKIRDNLAAPTAVVTKAEKTIDSSLNTSITGSTQGMSLIPPKEQEDTTEFERVSTVVKPAVTKFRTHKYKGVADPRKPFLPMPKQSGSARKEVMDSRKIQDNNRSKTSSISTSNSTSSGSITSVKSHRVKPVVRSSKPGLPRPKQKVAVITSQRPIKPRNTAPVLNKPVPKKPISSSTKPEKNSEVKRKVNAFMPTDMFPEEYDLSSPGAAVYTPNRHYPGKKQREERRASGLQEASTEILPEIDEISARDQEELSQFVDEGLEGGLPSDHCADR
ncbi:hypothetical protein L596_029429 [Steinernema carpocapsae]|uniref:Uncharacterized protein n=1 Tax=Steinernema carpocapsae TaxID=34508 RepID=A0A4U5LUM5_STECR|nr:hypothetical protein L596_029429 [Steinernema carpocapsae]